MAKIYIAARYSRKPEMVDYLRVLRTYGHIVRADWLTSNHDHTPNVGCAEIDVGDVKACDTILIFSEEPRTTNSRGGRHVELGMAIALDKRIIIVGPSENVFMDLPQITRVDTFPEVRDVL